ncbi:hypothetical protein XH86_12140 [Bradyrhizobium guangdongense]|uniref:Uncharacterized protein n=1 Tax=Bradyrhizobium guangdongense TaxID=1325090 RepID=A0ABX6UDK6_9BRAD|nr:hypothetical protein X265_12145 [Bradyrhizobium guangdongense]QOZ59397.1 hypothetical protein XH86_12140 [Bradyrhizobium guangdongense]
MIAIPLLIGGDATHAVFQRCFVASGNGFVASKTQVHCVKPHGWLSDRALSAIGGGICAAVLHRLDATLGERKLRWACVFVAVFAPSRGLLGCGTRAGKCGNDAP